jgi:hypothetical protein
VVVIPRALHWVWLGRDPVPASHQGWIDGWRDQHPTWESHVWSEADLVPLRNQALFDRATSWSQRSDIARYEVLLRHGGVYLDTDVECVRPLDDLLASCEAGGVEGFAGEERAGLVGSAVLGASTAHPWIDAVVAAMPSSMDAHFLTMEQTGPEFLTRVTSGRPDVKVFERAVFYPLSSTGDDVPIGPETRAVHHFSKSWAAEERARITAAAVRVLEHLVPVGATFVLVGDGLELDLPGRRSRPFAMRDGVDWGAPGDDEAALAELACQRAAGVEWFVFLASAFWWLDHYEQLARTLRAEAAERHEDLTIAAFRLPATERVAPAPR